LLWEIDALAAAEDRHGPAATKALVASVVRAARAALRDEDIDAVVGPGRFAVACRETSAPEAHARAELLRAAVAAAVFDVGAGARPEKVTASVGVAACAAGTDRGAAAAAALLRIAADALARAREGGGNRVESAPAPPVSP
jgi:diguanylate cyclase (GGDEF)-like protein